MRSLPRAPTYIRMVNAGNQTPDPVIYTPLPTRPQIYIDASDVSYSRPINVICDFFAWYPRNEIVRKMDLRWVSAPLTTNLPVHSLIFRAVSKEEMRVRKLILPVYKCK